MKSTAGILKKPSGNSSRRNLRSITLWQDLKKAFGLDSEGLAGLKALYRKEMMDNIRSRRFLVILVLIVVTSYASLYGALTGLASSGETDYLFLALYTTSGSSIPSFMSFIALLGPFVGIILGFDGITGEKSERTLYRIAAQPIYRDSIINGKFLAGTALIFLMVFTMGISIGAVGLLATGIPPSLEELGRVLVYLLFTSIYICFWLGLSLWFSVVCKNAAASAMAAIGVWIVCALFMGLIAGIIANLIYPMNNDYQALMNSMGNYTLELGINRISPYYLYSEAASTIMNPSVRAVNVITMESLSGAISGYLSLGQSLLLVWPHLAGLVALMLVTFAGSYICFMRQEIRSK